MRKIMKLFVVILCGALALSSSGCWPWGSKGGTENQTVQSDIGKEHPVQLVIGLDESISLDPKQMDQFREPVAKLIDQMKPDTRLIVFGIHDNTLYSKPIFEAEMPVMPDDPTYEEEMRVRKEWDRIRSEAKARVEEALRVNTRAKATDILSICNRIPNDSRRRTVLILVSDMLHSDRDFDLETMHPTDKGFDQRLNAAIAKRQLRAGMLKGVTVHCLLNSLSIRDAQPLNDRLVLRRLWSEVFSTLGAKLVGFDSRFTFNQGGDGVAANLQ